MSPAADAPGGAAPASRSVRLLGFVLASLAVGFCLYALARDWDRVSSALVSADPVLLVVTVLLGAASMTWLAVLWQRCLATLGAEAPLVRVVGWYFAGELGKYLPGGVWQLIGRGEVAHRDQGIARATSYASTLLAYATMCLGAAFLCGAAAPLLATGPRGEPLAWFFLPALAIVPVVIHPAPARLLLGLVGRLVRREIAVEPLGWRVTASLVAWSLPAWGLLGGSSAAAAAALGAEVNLVRVAVAAVAAWVVGFLAVPVPAGAGVREVTFVALCGLGAGPAVAVAVLARATLVAVDAIGGLIALATGRRGRPAASPTAPPAP